MKLLITLFLAISIVGCASLSDRGDVSETSVELPDGTTAIFIRIQRIRFFTPSTEEKITFMRCDGNTVRTNDLGQNHQTGIGSSLIDRVIKSGTIAVTAGMLK